MVPLPAKAIRREPSMHTQTRTGLLAAALACGLAHAARAEARALQTAHVPAEAAAANYAGPVKQGTQLHLAITLPMHNLTVLESLLTQLQDSRSAQYRHYLSVAEFTDRFGPTAAEYTTLQQFAAAHGLRVSGTSPNRFVLDVEGSVETIQNAFGVRMGLYRHQNKPGLFYAPDREPRMDIGEPVLHISGLDNAQPPVAYSARRPPNMAPIHANGSGPYGNYTAGDMRAAYYGGTALTGAGQIVGLTAFGGGFNIADIVSYLTNVGQSLTTPVVGISVDGVPLSCIYPGCDDTEQSIDIEQVIGMAPGLKQVSVYAGNTAIDILNRMATDNTAKSLSNSYGWAAEALVEDPVYMEFAAQGQTFVSATGDDGSNLKAGGAWPSDDNHVTAVGGTELATEWNGGPWMSEVAWPNSGGGPSPDNIHIPAWQKAFVNAQNMASPHLRNVPDVAAEANYDSYVCYDLVCQPDWGGTSFAAPRWAAFIALVNQQAAISKRRTVGFLNTRIYRLAAGSGYDTDFHDITQGSNGAYSAVVGFDDVTGLGSPQAALITALTTP